MFVLYVVMFGFIAALKKGLQCHFSGEKNIDKSKATI